MPRVYTDPVTKLLTYGRLTSEDTGEQWPDYLKLGLTRRTPCAASRFRNASCTLPGIIRPLGTAEIDLANVWGYAS